MVAAALPIKNVSQMYCALQGVITLGMEYIPICENMALAA
jgi:hypothetical protein